MATILERIEERLGNIENIVSPPPEEEGEPYDLKVASEKAIKALQESTEKYVKASDRLEAVLENMEAERRPNFSLSEEESTITSPKFARNRMIFLSAVISCSVIALIVSFLISEPLYITASFTVLFVFGILYIHWLIDKFYFEGDTLAKMVRTPVSAAITFVGLCIIIVKGFEFGNSIISDKTGFDRNQAQYTIPAPAGQPASNPLPNSGQSQDSAKTSGNGTKVSGSKGSTEH